MTDNAMQLITAQSTGGGVCITTS